MGEVASSTEAGNTRFIEVGFAEVINDAGWITSARVGDCQRATSTPSYSPYYAPGIIKSIMVLC